MMMNEASTTERSSFAKLGRDVLSTAKLTSRIRESSDIFAARRSSMDEAVPSQSFLEKDDSMIIIEERIAKLKNKRKEQQK